MRTWFAFRSATDRPPRGRGCDLRHLPMTSIPAQLEYAPRSKRRRWRRMGALALLLVLIAGGGLAIRHYRPRWQAKTQDMALDRACLDYTAPSDFVVYETDPAEVQKLLARGGGYRPGPEGACFSTPLEWMNYPLGKWTPGPAFLHERRSPAGNVRLVAIVLDPRGDMRFFPLVFRPTILQANRQTLPDRRDWVNRFLRVGLREPVRMFAGQPDRADPSHFTITLAIGGKAEVIDGWLRDDDTVDLRPRGGAFRESPIDGIQMPPVWWPDAPEAEAAPATAPGASGESGPSHRLRR